MALDVAKYNEALKRRPGNVRKLFPSSRALIVSGKVIHAAMERRRAAGRPALAIAANGRNDWVIEGALRAAHRTRSALLIEIAKSECGYCEPNFQNLAEKVDRVINEAELEVVVAIHADHYAIKSGDDLAKAKQQLPEMLAAGITSVAIDASHMFPHDNVTANLELAKLLSPEIALETEVGEIKGKEGLSTPEEALFHIKALNAHEVFPTWIAVNNGSAHGLEATGGNIDVELTAAIHDAIARYEVWGAQHGTSGNNYVKLRDIVRRTRTTKANVATALQMIAWGLEVNEFGNAQRDADGQFIKVADRGVSEDVWRAMVAHAREQGWTGGDYKKLNKPMNALLADQPTAIQQRMVAAVEDFAAHLIENVFDAAGSADEALEVILENESPAIQSAHRRIEDPGVWTERAIRSEGERLLAKQRKVDGDFDD